MGAICSDGLVQQRSEVEEGERAIRKCLETYILLNQLSCGQKTVVALTIIFALQRRSCAMSGRSMVPDDAAGFQRVPDSITAVYGKGGSYGLEKLWLEEKLSARRYAYTVRQGGQIVTAMS